MGTGCTSPAGWRNWSPAQLGLRLGGTCVIRPRNRLPGSWEEQLIPSFGSIVAPLTLHYHYMVALR